MRVRLKPGVRLVGMSPQIGLAISVAAFAFDEIGRPSMTVTSVTDGKHGRGSKHYVGNAVDIRTKDIPTDALKRSVFRAVAEDLGPEFDVVLEWIGEPQEHLHIEWDPK